MALSVVAEVAYLPCVVWVAAHRVPVVRSNFTSACCTSRLARGNAQGQTHSETSSNYLCANDGLETGGIDSNHINAWQAVWVDIFRATGFLANGCPAPRPEEPVTLYRGCGLGGQFGLAWTTDANTACLFGSGSI